jgi:hypothetical protein
MKIDRKENYILVEDEKSDIKYFSNYLANQGYRHLKDKNVIVNITKYGKLQLDQLLGFLKLSNEHRADGKSFVLINDTIDIEHLPPELMVVPTLREAEDVIQMEDIERDLGAF